MNTILEHTLGLDPHSNHDNGSDDQVRCHTTFKRFGSIIQRILMAFMAVAVSIAVPEFSSMLGILGNVFSFLLCIIGPLCAKMVIEKNLTKFDVSMMLIGVAMASGGTISLLYA